MLHLQLSVLHWLWKKIKQMVAPVEDSAIQGVKVGMMGPLAGVGDPVFWFTARPILGALGASLAMGEVSLDQSYSSYYGM